MVTYNSCLSDGSCRRVYAEVLELADRLDSGSSSDFRVRVQVPSSALIMKASDKIVWSFSFFDFNGRFQGFLKCDNLLNFYLILDFIGIFGRIEDSVFCVIKDVNSSGGVSIS